ncbi:MAG: hypothetical protein Ta2E_07460 [Mycoplasmoidaceae bacterium]|nr:MAG: hypothetical protein Ta2E_07460 [Mycoplasmoidaceae bacterium]
MGNDFNNTTLAQILLTSHYINSKDHDFFISFGNHNIEFSHYQYRPIIKMLEKKTNGILIADDVGIGKTIEAGIIIKEMIHRHQYKRILIICPNELVEKWKVELKVKFGLVFGHLNNAQFDTMIDQKTKLEDNKPLNAICTLSCFSRKGDYKFPEGTHNYFDLIIIDEAHHLRNHTSKLTVFVNSLRQHAKKVVLLSATPIQTKLRDMHTLLKIIDSATYQDYNAFSTILSSVNEINEISALLNDYIEGNRKKKINVRIGELLKDFFANIQQDDFYGIDMDKNNNIHETWIPRALQIKIINAFESGDGPSIEDAQVLLNGLKKLNYKDMHLNRTVRKEIGRFTQRDVHAIKLQFTDIQKEFYELTIKFIEDIVEKENIRRKKENQTTIPVGFICSNCERSMASSITAFCQEAYFKEFIDKKFANIITDIEDEDDNPEEDEEKAITKRIDTNTIKVIENKESVVESTVKHLFSLAEKIRKEKDNKFELFINFIKDAQKTSSNKIIIFTSSLNTLAYLEKNIKLSIPEIRLRSIMGKTDKEKRIEYRSDFALDKSNPKAVDILLCSEIGSEGLDLQFCNKLINYDIPWNPMNIEQRIGRVDRRGQKSKSIHIVSFLTEGTVEEGMYTRCFERINLFNEHIGGLERILGDLDKQVSKIMFSDNLSEAEKNLALQQVYEIVRTEKEHAEKTSPLIASNTEYDNAIHAARANYFNYYKLIVSSFLYAIIGKKVQFENDNSLKLEINDYKKLNDFIDQHIKNFENTEIHEELKQFRQNTQSDAKQIILYPDMENVLFKLFILISTLNKNKIKYSFDVKTELLEKGEYLYRVVKIVDKNNYIKEKIELDVYDSTNKLLFVISNFNDMLTIFETSKENSKQFSEDDSIFMDKVGDTRIKKMQIEVLSYFSDLKKHEHFLKTLNTYNEKANAKRKWLDYINQINEKKIALSDNPEINKQDCLNEIIKLDKVAKMHEGVLKKIVDENKYDQFSSKTPNFVTTVILEGGMIVK